MLFSFNTLQSFESFAGYVPNSSTRGFNLTLQLLIMWMILRPFALHNLQYYIYYFPPADLFLFILLLIFTFLPFFLVLSLSYISIVSQLRQKLHPYLRLLLSPHSIIIIFLYLSLFLLPFVLVYIFIFVSFPFLSLFLFHILLLLTYIFLAVTSIQT